MSTETNPFASDRDRQKSGKCWCSRDIAAFVAADWGMVADDFIESRLPGHPRSHIVQPGRLDGSLSQPRCLQGRVAAAGGRDGRLAFAEPLAPAIHRATSLDMIEITGDTAVAHKKFDGAIRLADGSADILNWQTLYFCRRAAGRWKITGFVGYMAYR